MNRPALLGTVLRGLRSRALLSVGSLVLIALAVGASVLGPMFQEASIRSYTVTRVDEASPPQTSLTWLAHARGRTDQPFADLVDEASTEVVHLSPADYADPQVTLVSQAVPSPAGPLISFLARRDACRILELQGRCPERAGEIAVNQVDLVRSRIGDTLDLPLLGKQTIVGSYVTPTTSDDWLLPNRLASLPSSASGPPILGPYLITPEAFDTLPSRVRYALLDSRLTLPDDLDDATFDALVRDTQDVLSVEKTLPGGGTLVGDSPVNALDDVLTDVRAQRSAARSAVAPAVLSLILVALAMILRLLGAAAELRAPELALASLRGVGRRRAWVLGLSEPWLLVLVGTPLGVVSGWLAARGLARTGLRPGIALAVPTASVVGAVLVALAIAAVAVLAVWQVQRETLGAQLGGGGRRPGRTSQGALLVELVVVILAAVLVLARSLSAGDGSLGLTDLLLPVVVAVAAGLLVTRLTVVAAARWTRRGSGGPISLFVAARAVSRRTQGTLVMLPITAAIAVSVFAVGVDAVAADWRASVAATRTPADVVYTSPVTLQETLDVSRTLDPEGRYTMAASRANLPTGPLVLVDASRLGRVGGWSEQWLDGAGAADAGRLLAPTPPVTVRAEEVGLTVTNDTREAGDVTVRLDLYVPGSGEDRVYLGPFPGGTSSATATVPQCTDGCEVRGLRLGGTVGTPIALHGPVTVTGLTADGEVLDGALTTEVFVADPDVTATPALTGLSDSAAGADQGITVETDTGSGPGVARLVSSTTLGPLPVIVGVDASDTVVPDDTGGTGSSIDVASERYPVTVVSRAESLPLLGPRGVLVDLPSLLARTQPSPALTEPLLLVRADAPASLTDSLAAQGFEVSARAADTRRSLDGSAYAQALRLYRTVAATLLLMALGGLLVSVATQLPARRRDAASLRVVGVPRRTVALASFWESALVLTAATVAGLAAGLLAEALLLRSLTLGVTDDVTTPRVQPTLDVGLVVVFAVAVAGVLLVVSALTSSAVVRRARASTLRETAR